MTIVLMVVGLLFYLIGQNALGLLCIIISLLFWLRKRRLRQENFYKAGEKFFTKVGE